MPESYSKSEDLRIDGTLARISNRFLRQTVSAQLHVIVALGFTYQDSYLVLTDFKDDLKYLMFLCEHVVHRFFLVYDAYMQTKHMEYFK